ncbi:MAG TPA: GNAT family N-acetyltransferase [Terriglobia bacterium]|jgi:predicted GNAT superfamily acetyltransferase|nr:GNAT family N-acetyltransferase [Terriglobia bacterium]
MTYTIRPCETVEEFAGCVVLQREIWGYPDSEIYPARMFLNISRNGGHVLGAFTSEGSMAGVVVSVPAWRKQHRYFYSLLLGVLPKHENKGLGRMLKIAQRKAALRDGIECIEWTFDPLRAKNAYFNIVRLGAIVRRYCPNYYGPVKSRLQRKLPSDRLIAEWPLKSARVTRALAGKHPRPARKAPAAQVAIPVNLDELLSRRSSRAREWQSYVRASLQDCFSRGLAITGFEKSGTEAWYILDRV